MPPAIDRQTMCARPPGHHIDQPNRVSDQVGTVRCADDPSALGVGGRRFVRSQHESAMAKAGWAATPLPASRPAVFLAIESLHRGSTSVKSSPTE